jgi:hypothetical protein
VCETWKTSSVLSELICEFGQASGQKRRTAIEDSARAMIDDQLGLVCAAVKAAFRRRADIEHGLGDDAEMQRRQSRADWTVFFRDGLFAGPSIVSESFQIALVTYDDAPATRVELLQDDGGRVDGQNPDIQNGAQNREGAHNLSESTGSSSRHVGSSSTNARRNQWRPGHTTRKMAEFNSVLGGSDQQL